MTPPLTRAQRSRVIRIAHRFVVTSRSNGNPIEATERMTEYPHILKIGRRLGRLKLNTKP